MHYVVETLKNRLQIVVMTIYVPANFIVKGTENFRFVKVTVSVRTTFACQEGYHVVMIDGILQCIQNHSNPPCKDNMSWPIPPPVTTKENDVSSYRKWETSPISYLIFFRFFFLA